MSRHVRTDFPVSRRFRSPGQNGSALSSPFQFESRSVGGNGAWIGYCLAIAFAYWTTGISFADQFQWKLAAGDSFLVLLEQKSTATTKYETRTSDLGTETRIELDWRVVSVEEDIARIEQTIERLTLSLQAPTADGSGRMEMDTRDLGAARGATPELIAQLQALVGLKFFVNMSLAGEIRGVDVPEATLEALRAAPSTLAFRQMLTPDGLRQLYGQSTFVLPLEAIQPNFSWQTESEAASPWGPLAVQTRYTYSGTADFENKPVAQFQIERNLAVTPAGDTAKTAELAEEARLDSQAGSGTFFFDSSAGHFVAGDFEQKIETTRTYRDQNLKTTFRNQLSLRIQKR